MAFEKGLQYRRGRVYQGLGWGKAPQEPIESKMICENNKGYAIDA